MGRGVEKCRFLLEMRNMALPSLEAFLRKPPQKRGQLRREWRGRGKYERRAPRDQQTLVEFLRARQVRSVRDLRRCRQPGEPMPADYIKAFGSWEAAKKAAFGRSFLDDPPPADAKYLISVLVGFRLWRYSAYVQARRNRPDIVPSVRQVRKQFGTFSNLRHYAERCSTERTLIRLLSLREQLGHWPSAEEQREAGLDLRHAIRCFGSSREMYSFADMLFRHGSREGQALPSPSQKRSTAFEPSLFKLSF